MDFINDPELVIEERELQNKLLSLIYFKRESLKFLEKIYNLKFNFIIYNLKESLEYDICFEKICIKELHHVLIIFMAFKTISISIIFVKIETFIIDIVKSPEKNVNVKLKMWTFNVLNSGF